MLPAIKGRQLMDALADLKGPSHVTDIARYLSKDIQIEQPKSNLIKTVKTALDAGVRYGYIEKDGNLYSVDSKLPSEDSDSDVDSVDGSRTHTETIAQAEAVDQGDCYGNQRGMRRRRAGEKRQSSRSRSRSARKSSRRRRR